MPKSSGFSGGGDAEGSGSARCGERAAMYTLIQAAKLNDVDPQAWLADVLARINDHTSNVSINSCPGTGTLRRLCSPRSSV
jgi:hypothetical protein